MSAFALKTYLIEHIPLARAMELSVDVASGSEVALTAPLAPNINVHGTAFGGSISTLGVLAAWSVMHLRLEEEQLAAQLVIHRNDTEFLAPISGAFQAVAKIDPEAFATFRAGYERRGKARLTVVAELLFEGRVAARMTGEFVAIREPA